MRWATESTWFRIAVLFDIYLLMPAAWFSLSHVSDPMETVKSLMFPILLAILPILAMGFGARDGVKEGFSLLWLLVPFVCFPAPMHLSPNDSALVYGVGYSLLGFGAHCVGAFIHMRSSRRMQVCNGSTRTLKATTRICPHAQTPSHPGVAFSGVALSVLRRLKARAAHKHMEESA